MPIHPDNRARYPKPLPSKERLLELLAYDPETGVIQFREGGRSFAITTKGYLQATIDGVTYYAHRIIWKMLHDEEPPQIDHRDGDRANNRKANLRAGNHTINNRNAKKRRDNTSGICGVSWYAPRGCWRAHIRLDGKRRHLGYFKEKSEAARARLIASREHGFGERHGL